LGKAATVFPMPIENEAQLCTALQKGRFWPLLFGAPPPGLSSGATGADRAKVGGGQKKGERDRERRGWQGRGRRR
jgi:hypothetical protein